MSRDVSVEVIVGWTHCLLDAHMVCYAVHVHLEKWLKLKLQQ